MGDETFLNSSRRDQTWTPDTKENRPMTPSLQQPIANHCKFGDTQNSICER